MITAKCITNRSPWPDEPIELEEGKEYEVENIDMGQSYTSITLKDIKDHFNSLCFNFFEDGNPIDIYTDKRFNPYLRHKDK